MENENEIDLKSLDFKELIAFQKKKLLAKFDQDKQDLLIKKVKKWLYIIVINYYVIYVN